MPAVAHDLEGEIDRVAHVFQPSDPRGPQLGAFHHAGVELDDTVEVQARSDAGIEERLVLHVPDGGRRRGQGAVADLRPARIACSLDSGLPERAFSFGDRPRAAVDDQRRPGHSITRAARAKDY
jgi:hypothetical protein